MAEKTEQPTDKKRRDAKRDGQVAHSQDIGQLVSFLAALLFFWIAGDTLLSALGKLLLAPAQVPLDMPFIQQAGLLGERVLRDAAKVLLPLLLAVLVAGLAGDLFQNGPMFTPKRIKPSFSKLNIWSNLKSRFAVPALVDLVKMIAKTALLLSAAGIAVAASFRDILLLSTAPPQAAWSLLGEMLRWLAVMALVILVPVALLDLFWQRSQLTKKLKMSIDEVRREFKETEGAPEIKGERRRRHQELSTEEIRARVKRSSVLVVNPVHFVVGLHYQPGVTPLPVIVFKDFGGIVPRIRRIARECGVPVIRYPALARNLYAQGVVGRFIPSETIEAVAEAMSHALNDLARKNDTPPPVAGDVATLDGDGDGDGDGDVEGNANRSGNGGTPCA